MGNEIDFSEFMDVFLQEASEQLEKLDDGLLRLEKTPQNTDILNEIFRAAHTLKGSSASMGFSHIRDLTHDAENLLDALRSADEAARAYAVDALLGCTAVLRSFVESLREGDTSVSDMQADVEDARKRIASSMPGARQGQPQPGHIEGSTADGHGTRFIISFHQACQMPGVRAFMALQILEGAGKILWAQPNEKEFDSLKPQDIVTVGLEIEDGVNTADLAKKIAGIAEIAGCDVLPDGSSASGLVAAASEIASKASANNEPIQTVRVAVDRLDKLVNLIGEMVVDRTGLALVESALTKQHGAEQSVQSLGSIANHLGRVVADLHEEIMKMRMLPVDHVFRRFPRMVRDLAHKLEKKVELELEGEQTGLDRSILEDIVDPLTHLLRNAVDHGIESPQQRLALGKAETGTIVLSARHEEGNVVIEIADDGHGIDAAKVRDSAVAKGAITKEAAAKLNDQEAMKLLFVSGVSTAEEITDVSGRGVGMDVVKANIEKLHGQVEVDSALGQGSRFSVRLPLTLAIVQALLVRCGKKLLAIPLASVVSAARQERSRIHIVEGVPCLVVRGRTLPVLSMRTVFKDQADTSLENSDLLLVIVQSRGRQAAFAVDELIGKMDVVVKSLGAFLGDVPGVSGAAILGDGRLALIADVASILELAKKDVDRKAA